MISRAPMRRNPGGLTTEIRQYGSPARKHGASAVPSIPARGSCSMFSPEEAWAQTSGVLASARSTQSVRPVLAPP
jgi:hypothetical protein